MATFPALAHVAVTVSDLDRSTRWYGDLFGAEPVLDEDETVGGFHHTVFVLDGGQLFGLHTHPGSGPDGPFNERRAGMDHVAFQVGGVDDVQSMKDRFAELGVDHSDVKTTSNGTAMVTLRDPDNIQLEVFGEPLDPAIAAGRNRA